MSLGTNGVGLGNATGVSDLTIDDNSANQGVLTLSTASPYFYGNIIIGNNHKPTVIVTSDAALGNTMGPAASIGEIDLNRGTLQAGASFAAPERNLFLGSPSKFDVAGFTTSWGSLTDVQRTLTVLNSNATTAGAVTFRITQYQRDQHHRRDWRDGHAGAQRRHLDRRDVRNTAGCIVRRQRRGAGARQGAHHPVR